MTYFDNEDEVESGGQPPKGYENRLEPRLKAGSVYGRDQIEAMQQRHAEAMRRLRRFGRQNEGPDEEVDGNRRTPDVDGNKRERE